jgi:putative sterol carrier protein
MSASVTLDIDSGAFSSWVRGASDSELASLIGEDRDALLDEIFRRMEHHFDRAAAGDLDAVIEWRIVDRPGGGLDRYQARIAGGRCRVQRDGSDAPRLTIDIRPAEFLRVVTGAVSGPRLFMLRRVRVGGDLMLAGRLASLFRIPEPEGDGHA